MKFLIVVTLLGIVASLGHAMFSMSAGPQNDNRMVNALTVRVGLSVTLFALLFVGWHFGLIRPHGS